MKDFPAWREAIQTAKALPALKSIGEDLARFQKQSGLFEDEEKKLNDSQILTLRKMYTEKMQILEKETLPPRPPTDSKFKK